MNLISSFLKLSIFLSIFFLYGLGTAQVTSFPWTEDFESATFPPEGWTILDVSGTQTWTGSTIYAHGGTKSAFHEYGTGGVHETALITPPITLPNSGEAVLDFWSYTQYVGYDYSGILVSTTVNNNINAFTQIKVLAGDEVTLGYWRHIENISLEAFSGQTIYIAFLYRGNNAHRWFVDDVKITHLGSYIDIQPTAITPITGDYAMLSANEQVTVRIKNNGGAPASGFNVKLLHNDNLMATEVFTGSIPSLGESTYIFNTTLNLSAAGMHKVQAMTDIAGDQVPGNDIITAMVNNLGCQVVSTFPYTEGFENNGNNLPPCWTQEFVAENYKWRVTDETGAYNMPGMEPVQAFEGIYRAFFYTNGKDGAVTKLIAPPMDITSMSNPVLKFHHVQQHYAGDQDSLKVYYRTSQWGAWVLLEKYTEMLVDWTERTIPLPEPSSQYYIAFEGYAEWGASIQIDNIFVGQLFETDIAVKAITPSGVHLGLSAQQEVTATIKNNGREPVTGFDLTLYFNGNFMATETFTGTIPGLGEVSYTFNATVDISITGTYTLTVVADLIGDEVEENNELTVIVKNLVCNAITFPYEEDFEENIFPPHCWSIVGEWQRLTYGAHSSIGRASYAWWYGSLGWLISPKLSIPAGGDFVLEFWSHVYEARFFSNSEVMISTTNNNTSSFTVLYALGSGDIPESVWTKIAVSLSDYAGQDIYLAFRYRNSGGQTGHMWSIDDVNIFNLNAHVDAELVAITAPPSQGINLTSQEAVTIQVRNNGDAPINGFQLKLEHDGTVVATEIYTGVIPSMATANYTFATKLDLSAAGMHTVTVTVILANDMNPDNDSKTKTVENILSISDITAGKNPLVAYVKYGILYVEGLNIGDTWSVYNAIGKLLYRNVANNEVMTVKQSVRGLYIIQSGNRVVKAVY